MSRHWFAAECSVPIPAFGSINSRMLLLLGHLSSQTQLAKAHQTLTALKQNHKQQKRSSFDTAQGDATWPLSTRWCQLLAGENTALRSLVAEPQPHCAPGQGRRIWSAAGASCWLPTGIPWALPDMSSHTRTAGGGKMPSSSRRDSTGCSQRCS